MQQMSSQKNLHFTSRKKKKMAKNEDVSNSSSPGTLSFLKNLIIDIDLKISKINIIFLSILGVEVTCI